MRDGYFEGSPELGAAIKNRREELGLTVAEAARAADMSTQTWKKYESGGSVRNDKIYGICIALDWDRLPGMEKSPMDEMEEKTIPVSIFQEDDAWSSEIAEKYGDGTAVAFVLGSSLLLEELENDLDQLSKMPRGTHIGMLKHSWLTDMLPDQFLMSYDYDFIYYWSTVIFDLRDRAANPDVTLMTNTLLEDISLFLIMEESDLIIDKILPKDAYKEENWAFYYIGDPKFLDHFFNGGAYIPRSSPYHFDHWAEDQIQDGPTLSIHTPRHTPKQ